jgi:hypothetical protein
MAPQINPDFWYWFSLKQFPFLAGLFRILGSGLEWLADHNHRPGSGPVDASDHANARGGSECAMRELRISQWERRKM